MVLAALALGLLGPDSRGSDDLPQAGLPTDLPIPIAEEDDNQPGGPLVPGQVVVPIDLAGAIRLAGGAAIWILPLPASSSAARSPICSMPGRSGCRRCSSGPTWYRLDGKVQTITGQVINTSRSSLFIGGLAASANSYPAAPPGSGFPPPTGMVSVLRFSDAIFLSPGRPGEIWRPARPMSGRRRTTPCSPPAKTTSTSSWPAGCSPSTARRPATPGSWPRSPAPTPGRAPGWKPTTSASSPSSIGGRADIEHAVGQLEVASTKLVQLLVLDPNQVLAPIEPAESVFRLLADETPLDEMIVQGLHQRPELASSQELVQATLMRLKQARLRPLIPSMAFSYAGGGFGGGQNGFFGNFGTRGDATVSLYWELQNLGFTDLAIARRSLAENRAAMLRLVKVENQVAAEVAAAYKTRVAADRRMAQAAPEVAKAIESLRLNMLNIRRGAGLPGATRPIEVLQPIQALAQARTDYLHAVLDYNRAQFRLYHAIGWPPLAFGSQPDISAPARSGSPAVPRAGSAPSR